MKFQRRLWHLANSVTFSDDGYGIIFRREHFGRQILAHECRHIYQYERMGIGRFLDEYLRQVLTHGYKHAPLEIDARAAASGLNPSTRAGSC